MRLSPRRVNASLSCHVPKCRSIFLTLRHVRVYPPSPPPPYPTFFKILFFVFFLSLFACLAPVSPAALLSPRRAEGSERRVQLQEVHVPQAVSARPESFAPSCSFGAALVFILFILIYGVVGMIARATAVRCASAGDK